MNQCPKCGKVMGLHSSILPGCMCEWSMHTMKEGKDFTISKPWVGLTEDEIVQIGVATGLNRVAVGMIETKLREKNT